MGRKFPFFTTYVELLKVSHSNTDTARSNLDRVFVKNHGLPFFSLPCLLNLIGNKESIWNIRDFDPRQPVKEVTDNLVLDEHIRIYLTKVLFIFAETDNKNERRK